MTSAQLRVQKLNDNNFMVWSCMLYALLIERDLASTLNPEVQCAADQHAKAVAVITLHRPEHLLYLVDPSKPAHVGPVL